MGPRTGLQDVEKRKTSPPPGLELRPLGRPARNQSPYQLCYPGSRILNSDKYLFFTVMKYFIPGMGMVSTHGRWEIRQISAGLNMSGRELSTHLILVSRL
jgi:hypothetical protein